MLVLLFPLNTRLVAKYIFCEQIVPFLPSCRDVENGDTPHRERIRKKTEDEQEGEEGEDVGCPARVLVSAKK